MKAKLLCYFKLALALVRVVVYDMDRLSFLRMKLLIFGVDIYVLIGQILGSYLWTCAHSYFQEHLNFFSNAEKYYS